MNQLLKDQRKEQILSAALNVISKKGYDQSRMDDIVTKSNLSKGAIYWYYKSKKEIYLSLIDHWVSEYSSGVFEEIENINFNPPQKTNEDDSELGGPAQGITPEEGG